MGNTFTMLLGTGLVLTALVLAFKKPLLYLFGASDATFPYADGYLTIYLCGTVFVMLGLGMNNFINAQGFGSMGMITVLLGAVVNIILDPVFIFALGMGVWGRAGSDLTVSLGAVGRGVSLRAKALPRLRPSSMRVSWKLVGEICALGLSGFIMSATNSAVQVVCNATLQRWGGDVYVGVMTVLNSVREITTTPVMGITNAAQPVIGFNFGAGEYKRVRSGIQFMSAVCVGYTAAVWLCLFLFPQAFIRLLFRPPLLAAGVPSMHVYFFGFFMMALQFAGQSTNTALGRARQAVFFSLLRKAVIVIPLTLWLPGRFGLGVNGVFLAEPISNFLGGGACFVTMLLTVWPDLKRRERLRLRARG
ncbi:MAG: MATE family efflux transporter [Ruthenibacterium lactatiformans]